MKLPLTGCGAAVVALLAILYLGMDKPAPKTPPLVGKLAPHFDLPLLETPSLRYASDKLDGRVWVLNFNASWCRGCREEHDTILALAQTKVAPLVGLHFKDRREDALDLLRRAGNAFDYSVSDTDGSTGVAYGLLGVPETFVIDKRGVIRYRHAGPLTPEILKQMIPLVQQLKGE